ncbi:WD-repeat protein WDR6, WD repeat superfamily [Plasmopara halstedii]|uniref:WD-repeat protein WDR6, WD repeat superfamily n=1 Tax=Plasmopara halstedii TaxID=4781 RepID=A0A0P1A6N5_PLAHL|nr:WD-repeat protein WDR6, WD repeat superfamily [Plasmopara halstedii]CEG36287.1 WD-repeat protein WDR6, WD repeat superfamily [Plasmopara halstedii]|eukprot:XP_024572656.1 WD-repeat protein WDR6, WD repeat superfamily [Plasmopara halstedii]
MATATVLKQEFLGSVTLVSFSSTGSLLYVGVGPVIFLYSTTDCDFLGDHNVLMRGILHGCDITDIPVSSTTSKSFVGAFYGQKRVACFQNLPQTPDAARGLEHFQVLGKPKVFCDWVFDVVLLTDDISTINDGNVLAAVGLAHNLVQIWNPISNTILHSLQCAERCILYALAFHGRSLDDLVVASGTVFQQILLWNPMEHADEVSDKPIEPAQRLHAHDGVLLKLVWSLDARFLASVSDDRTVQLWSHDRELTNERLHKPSLINRAELLANGYTTLFRAWGHSARIWDVAFWERGLATASEDGLCKLWNRNGHCVATLQGHMGRNVWRIAVHPSLNLVATGGGDGAAKLWDITHQLMSSSSVSEASEFFDTICIPISKPSTGMKNKALPSDSVRNILLSDLDNGKTAFVASENGDIFHLDLSSLVAKLIYSMAPARSVNVRAKTNALSTCALDYSERFLLLGETSGLVHIVEASTSTLLYSWTTQKNVRVMKMWWDQEDAVFISSADGALGEWKPLIAEASENLPSFAITMKHVKTFQIPAKSSTSSLIVIDRQNTRNVFAGDGHGNIYAFHRSFSATECDNSSKEVQIPVLVLKGVHRRQLVASILLSEEHTDAKKSHHTILLSGGHDGYICSYVLTVKASGAMTAKFKGRESIRGISTVKQLLWSKGSSAHSTTPHDLLVFGFHATQAVLYNYSAQYRIFNVECGGWRRPHAIFTGARADKSALPSHTFVFTPSSSRKHEVDVKVHSTKLTSIDPGEHNPRFSKCSLHDQHHGRMTTCVAFIGHDRLITAADDNRLMLHRRRSCGRQEKGRRWTSVATGTAHTTTIRALTTFQRRGCDGILEHIVLSGGGKQRLNVWLICGDSDLLRLICGQERAEAAQDHRILGLATFAIPSASDAYRLVAACNSEGSTQLLLLDIDHEKLIEIGDCQLASRKPILSCVGFQNCDDDAVVAGLAVGSTDGFVMLWDLSAVLKEIAILVRSNEGIAHYKQKLENTITKLQLSGNYIAHDMGVNCFDLVSCNKSSDGENLDVTLISGGDDQSLYLSKFRFPSCQILFGAKTVNASGAAVKSVGCVDAKVIFAAGYDQRVSKWNICVNEDSVELEWQGVAFSECADIADLATRLAPTGMAYDVVIVGQGLQMLQYQR